MTNLEAIIYTTALSWAPFIFLFIKNYVKKEKIVELEDRKKLLKRLNVNPDLKFIAYAFRVIFALLTVLFLTTLITLIFCFLAYNSYFLLPLIIGLVILTFAAFHFSDVFISLASKEGRLKKIAELTDKIEKMKSGNS